MSHKRSGRHPLLAPRSQNIERVLVPAGKASLTLEALERRCLARLTRMLAAAAIWPTDDYGTGWKLGDFNILIVETTVAPDAALYVQFWSEPEQPVAWEVSSGRWNPPARRFITARAKRRLRDMGFEIGGKAGNFGKEVGVGNRGDAGSVARDVLRIFHDALGYRGATPLVARLTKGERAGRAVVHTRFDPEDVVNLLSHMGCATQLKKDGERPVVLAVWDGFRFAVTLDAPGEDGSFTCLDVTALVGHVTEETEATWITALNDTNGRSRVVRGWIDGDGDVIVGTSLMCARGLTAEYLEDQIAGWHRAALALAAGPPAKEGDETGGDDSDPDDPDSQPPKRRTGEVVH
jgi:hypothetical protein